ncbi:Structure-specific endonuclease subunit SLX4 [Pseudolycoriella hygida]|uniref:Structure-specific endonuclease subunit SLX4 n=1 Tax=Pseudolycoriella hygida TaxID=35572 RepID=A0A9Q0N3J6_9DIPT|nr:Structure-specific endonuclease subunit SLX4 [Pseudolycoriella hygida]
MEEHKNQPSNICQISSKSPPQIVNFFTKPLSSNDVKSPQSSSNDRKRKFLHKESSNLCGSLKNYADTLQKDAVEISKIKNAKKTCTLVSTFFQNGNSDTLSDFESPSKRIQFKERAVIPKKKLNRKRKQPIKQAKIKNALETKIFEKVLAHHSTSNCLDSDDLQMALALSRSLVDTHATTGESELSNISHAIRNAESHRKEDIVRKTFQQFGFKKRDNNGEQFMKISQTELRANLRSDYNYRDFFANIGPKKRLSRFTPLTRRTEKKQKKKLTEKVKLILQISAATGSVTSETLKEYCVTSETLEEYCVTSGYLLQFFCSNSPSYNSSLTVREATVEDFYVNNLVPVSTLLCGSMLKNWTDIPGREYSPVRNATEIDDTKNSSGPYGTCDTNILISFLTNDTDRKSNECKFSDSMNPLLCEEANAETENTRGASPDMFADYEASANNSLLDALALQRQRLQVDVPGPLKFSELPVAGFTGISSYSSDLEINITSKTVTRNENADTYKIILSANPTQDNKEPIILLSSDESNDGTPCTNILLDNSNEFEDFISHLGYERISPLSIGTRQQDLAKRLSFTERLAEHDSLPSLMGESSQNSIVLLDDEIKYSFKNDDEESPTKNVQKMNDNSNELYDPKEIVSSQLSICVSTENVFGNENSEDINIDDERFDMNHSSDDADFVNLSIQKMYREEFNFRSTKHAKTKSLMRTASDTSFERNFKKSTKTPQNFNCSYDEHDDFDKLVQSSSSEDEIYKLVKSRHGSSVDVSASSILRHMQTNQFVVESMDQIYEVKTGKLVSPKPDYEIMDAPTLLEHLKMYGLKAMSKRKAVICLEHIYNRLHPFVELNEDDDVDNILCQKKTQSIQPVKRIDDMEISYEVYKSLANSYFDVLQEKEDVFYLPSIPRAKKPWCLEPLHVAWYNLINSNSCLYDCVLQYKPIDIKEIESLFKSIDLRFEINDIISFLDRRCVIFKKDS